MALNRIDKNMIDKNFVTQVDDTASQLAGTTSKTFSQSLVSHRNPSAILSFVDDDGRPEVYSLLKPIVEHHNIPFTSAIIPSRVGSNDSVSMNLSQIKELQSIGFEFVSHTNTHPRLADITTLEEIENELKLSKEWLRKNGFNSDTAIVYPFGSHDERVREVARKYYEVGIDVDVSLRSEINYPPINTYELKRVYYNLDDGTNRIDTVKQKIDEAIATGGYIIVGMHCFYQGFDAVGLGEIILYAKQQGIDIVSLEEGINRYANLIDIPQSNKPLSERIYLGGDGNGNLKDYKSSGKFRNEITINTPITSFSNGKTVTYYTSGHANVTGFPANGGILETYKGNDDYNYQEFLPYQTNYKYIRYWNSNTNKWSAFKEIKNNTHIDDNVNNENDYTYFNTGITVSRVQGSNATGLPDNTAGLIITYKQSSSGYGYQTYKKYNAEELWIRHCNVNGTWGVWKPIIGGSQIYEDIALGGDWTGNLKCSKNNQGQVHVHGNVVAGTSRQLITTLPLKYMPQSYVTVSVYNYTQDKVITDVLIQPNGSISFRGGADTHINSGDSIRMDILFQVY